MNTHDLEQMSNDLKKRIDDEKKAEIEKNIKDKQAKQQANLNIEKRKSMPVSEIRIDDSIILPILDKLENEISNSFKSSSGFYPGTGKIFLFKDSEEIEHSQSYWPSISEKSNIWSELFPNERKALVSQLHEMLLKKGLPYVDLVLLYEKGFNTSSSSYNSKVWYDLSHRMRLSYPCTGKSYVNVILFFQVILKIEKDKYDLSIKSCAKKQNKLINSGYDDRESHSGVRSEYIRKTNIPSKAFERLIDFRKLKYQGKWMKLD